MDGTLRAGTLALVALALLLAPHILVAQTTHDVSISGAFPAFFFSPQDITIQQGDIVRWTNNTAASHTTTSGTACTGDGLWDSGLLASGRTFSRTFNDAPGTLPYFCIPHCLSGMTGTITIDVVTGIGDSGGPPEFTLNQNVPNPFAVETAIEYEIAGEAFVEIRVYNLKGQLVNIVENTARNAGRYLAQWDGRDSRGTRQATGVYFYQMSIDGVAVEMKKLVLLR